MKNESREELWGINKNVFALGLMSLFTDISSQMIFPLVPLFLSNVLGAGKGIIGLIEGVAESTASLLKVFSGWLSDKMGRRKFLIFGGYSFSAVSKIIFALSTIWQHVLVGRFLDRVGKGVRTSPRDALIADSISRERRGRYFGFHRMMDSLGGVIGTLLAYFFLSRFHSNYRQVFLIAIAPAVVAVLFILKVKEKRPLPEGTQRLPLKEFRLVDKRFKLFIAISLLFSLGNFSFAFFILKAEEMGVAVSLIPLVWLVYNIAFAVSATPMGALSDRVGRKKVLALGYALFGGVSLGFLLTGSPLYVWLLFAIYGVFMAVFESVSRAFASDLARPEMRGTALGIYHTTVGLAAFPANAIAGLLWRSWGSLAIFSYGAGLAFFSSLLLLFTIKEEKAPSQD
ncbi:MAG: MFS transporter [Acidobacteriota bacterium]